MDMAYSYWQYMSNHSDETLPFEKAISETIRIYRKSEEFRKSCRNWWPSYLYLERGLYSTQVKRYFDLFSKFNVRVYIFERFAAEPKKVCRDIFKFLNVDPSFNPKCYKVKNKGGEIRFNCLSRLRMMGMPLILKKFFPLSIRDKIRWWLIDFNIKEGNKRPQICSRTRKNLEEFFCIDTRELERLIGFEIPEWRPQ